MPAISRDQVAHLARLSRLALSADELDHYATQLDSILSHVKTITDVAADDVPPTANASLITAVAGALVLLIRTLGDIVPRIHALALELASD